MSEAVKMEMKLESYNNKTTSNNAKDQNRTHTHTTIVMNVMSDEQMSPSGGSQWPEKLSHSTKSRKMFLSSDEC